MKNKLQVAAGAAMTVAIANPAIATGITATIFGGWLTYRYLPTITYSAAALGGISFGNHKLADIAVEEGNSGLYDYTATVSEMLNKISSGYFSKVDSNPVLASGIDNSDPEMVQAAIMHGADVNREVNGIRPVERALDLNNGAGNVITQKLIEGGADLSKNVQEANAGNLFHKTLQTGKQELVQSALTQANHNPALIESVDANGNNLAHIEATSSDIRQVAQEARVDLTSNAINAGNRVGKTPVDVAMHSYKGGNADPKLVTEYFAKGSAHTTQPYFGEVITDPALPGTAQMVIGKGDFNPNIRHQGHLPLDYAVEYGTDELTGHIVHMTDSRLYQNQHLWQAYQRPELEGTRSLLEKSLFTTVRGKEVVPDVHAQQLFFQNPAGDGESLASKMILNPAMFDAETFRQVYATTKAALGPYRDPLSEQTALGLNWLHTAAIVGNKAAVDTITAIMQAEGNVMQNHVSALTAENGRCLAALYHHGFSEKVQMLTDAEPNMGGLITGLTQQYKALPAPQASADEGGELVAARVREEGKLVLSKEYLRQEEEYLHRIAELKGVEARKHLERQESLNEAQEVEEMKEDGIPQEIKLAPMERHVLEINQGAVVAGGLMKQMTISKGLVTAVTGSDIAEGNIPLWTTVFGIGGYLEAYGKCHTNPGQEAIVGAAVYGVTSYMTQGNVTELPGYTAPEERGIGDFAYKYGAYIAASPVANLIFQGASAYTGGYVGGAKGILKSVGTATAISTTVSYNLYTTDPTTEAKELSYTDYFTLENAFAASVAGYIGYHAAVAGTATVTAVAATASTPVIIAASVSSGLYALSKTHSAWAMTKLASGTLSPLTTPIKESVYDIAASIGDMAYNYATETLETVSEWWNREPDTSNFKCYLNSTTVVVVEGLWDDMCPAIACESGVLLN